MAKALVIPKPTDRPPIVPFCELSLPERAIWYAESLDRHIGVQLRWFSSDAERRAALLAARELELYIVGATGGEQ